MKHIYCYLPLSCHYVFILGQVWYLIVLIPDHCTLTYIVGILTFISMVLHVQHLRDLKQETYSIVSILVFMSS